MYAHAHHRHDSRGERQHSNGVERCMAAHVDGHLVDMNPFFYAELGNQDVESSIQYADYFGLADNGTITLGQIRYKDAKEKMGGLLLCELCRVTFTSGIRT